MPKKWINLVLSTAVIIIWIVIFYKFFFAQDNQENFDDFSEKKTLVHRVSNKMDYADKKQGDPFKNPFNTKRKIIEKTKQKPRPKQHLKMPNIKLLGILTDERGKLAIIEFVDGSTQFIRIGDTVQDIKVNKIEENEIEVEFEKQKIKIRL